LNAQAVGVPVGVAVVVGVPLNVAVGVGVTLKEGVGVGIPLEVAVGVGVGDMVSALTVVESSEQKMKRTDRREVRTGETRIMAFSLFVTVRVTRRVRCRCVGHAAFRSVAAPLKTCRGRKVAFPLDPFAGSSIGPKRIRNLDEKVLERERLRVASRVLTRSRSDEGSENQFTTAFERP
jgi:hypothetical protein